jgi:DNA polymerase III delta prime subunit
MNSFLIIGSDHTQRQQYISGITGNQIELVHVSTEKSSITIKQIQDLTSSLVISPRIPKIIWIEEANLMTTAAQNALLKILEEPPLNTSFYLTCQTSTSLLPTIVSRTQLIKLDKESAPLDFAVLTDLKLILGLSAGDRIQNIVKRDRAESINWLMQIESAISAKISDPALNQPSLSILTKIASLTQKSHLQLLANCSVSLVTQNFYLLLPHTGSQT